MIGVCGIVVSWKEVTMDGEKWMVDGSDLAASVVCIIAFYCRLCMKTFVAESAA